MKGRNIQLPIDFAQRILECDIQITLADQPSKQTFKNLTQLYMMGVQYYQSIRNYRYIYFQKKMNALFTLINSFDFSFDSKTEKSLEQPQSPLKAKMKSNNESQKIQALMIKQKQQKLKNAISQQTQNKNTGNQIKTFMQKSDILVSQYENKIKNQIDCQEKKLQSKILKRKLSNLSKSSFQTSMRQLKDRSTRSSLLDGIDCKQMTKEFNGNISQRRRQINGFNLISIIDQDQEGQQAQLKQTKQGKQVQKEKSKQRKRQYSQINLQKARANLKKSTSQIISQ